MRELETEAYAAAAAHRPAREAIDAVPAEARMRLTPLRSVQLACTGSPRFVDGRPLSADARHAALICGTEEGADYQIVDLVSGGILQHASTQPFHDSGAFAYADGADVTLVAYRSEAHSPAGMLDSGRAPLWAMRADRALAPLALPPPGDVRGKRLFQGEPGVASLSGRYAYVQFVGPRGALIEAVYDVAAQRLVWSETTAERRRGEVDRKALLVDETQEGPALVSQIFGSAGMALQRLNLQTGADIQMYWPSAARDQLPERFDERRLLLLRPGWRQQSAAPNATLINLMTLTTVWRGRDNELPAESYSLPFCSTRLEDRSFRAAMQRGRSYLATLRGVGEPIVLESARMQALANCAVSSDGRALALMLERLVHIYRIEGN